MMNIRHFIGAAIALVMSFVVCCTPESAEQGSKYGDLDIIWGDDSFSVEAGGTLAIPFNVLGSEGVALKLEAECSLAEVSTKLKYDADYAGTITVTAPAISNGGTAKVTLKVSDSHNRAIEKSVDLIIGKSEDLSVVLTAPVASMAVKGGGSFEVPFTINGVGPATINSSISATITSGWSAAASLSADGKSGIVKITAPASVSSPISVKITVTDNYSRSASLEFSLNIVEITTAANAANCHIVKPGSTLTIKAVKGNSPTELDFNNAVLVWQDALGLVKSVSGNGTSKAVVVELNSGIIGNAVVAARKDSVVVWSWHVWVTDYNPMDDPFVFVDSLSTKHTFMDRNLGAVSAKKYSQESFGLLYQWGRKDPFVGPNGYESTAPMVKYNIQGERVYDKAEERKEYNDYTSTNLQYAIEHPDIFLCCSQSSLPIDWLTDKSELQDNDLWGGVSNAKTIYDPCPEGWMVPPAGICWSFRLQYKKDGNLNSAGAGANYHEEAPWYCDYYQDAGFRYKQADGKEYWFPFPGHRELKGGTLYGTAGGAQMHTRSTKQTYCMMQLYAWGNPSSETGLNRPYGSSVRCIKE